MDQPVGRRLAAVGQLHRHLLAVGVLQPGEHVQQDVRRLVDRQGPALRLHLLQDAAAVTVLHGQEKGALRAAGVVQLDDVAVAQGAGQVRLAEESAHGDRVGGHLGEHHLERHALAAADVARQVDRAHPAAVQLALDLVALDGRQGAVAGVRQVEQVVEDLAGFRLAAAAHVGAAAVGPGLAGDVTAAAAAAPRRGRLGGVAPAGGAAEHPRRLLGGPVGVGDLGAQAQAVGTATVTRKTTLFADLGLPRWTSSPSCRSRSSALPWPRSSSLAR